MKKKISLKLFFTVIIRGIWQAICWVTGILGLKGDTKLGKCLNFTILGCLIILLVVYTAGAFISFACDMTEKYYETKSKEAFYSQKHEHQLGKDYTYVIYQTSDKPGYIIENSTGRTVIDGIVWLIESNDGDSLAVYKSTNGKRGYINRYTGKVQIKPQFDRAWIFSSGLASVFQNGEIHFIDHQGRRAFDKTFEYPWLVEAYCFHGDHCIIHTEDGMMGLIDKKGNWALPPEYSLIERIDNGSWLVHRDRVGGVLSDSLTAILPIEYYRVTVDQNGICASKDGERKLYDMDGNVLRDFLVQNVGKLYFPADPGMVFEDDNAKEEVEAECMWYDIDYDHYGLMDRNGHPVTKAIYSNVEAITANRFKCELSDGNAIILDQNGNEVR